MQAFEQAGVGDGMSIYLALRDGKRATVQPKLLCHQALSGFASAPTAKTKTAPQGAALFSGVGDGSRTHDLQGHNLAL